MRRKGVWLRETRATITCADLIANICHNLLVFITDIGQMSGLTLDMYLTNMKEMYIEVLYHVTWVLPALIGRYSVYKLFVC